VTSGPTAAAGENPLVGTQWALESMGSPGAEIPVLSGSNVTLSFESDTQVGGSAGCNSFGGNYKVDGNKITFDQLIHTMMACADESVMQQENAYMNALQMAGTYELSGDRLVISYNDGQGALNFVKTSG
jgi:heat shock protein HslJ